MGWWVDLTTASLRLNERSIGKLLFVLFAIDLSKKHGHKVWALLHSLAERYAQGIAGMAPFVDALRRMLGRLR